MAPCQTAVEAHSAEKLGMAKKKPTILLVDDHLANAAGLALLLDKHGFQVVGQLDRAQNAMTFCKESPPELVLMDTAMPGTDPFTAAEKILKSDPEIKLVFYAGEVGDQMLDRALEIKAHGFITKQQDDQALVFGLQQVANGQSYFSPELQKRLVRTRGIKPRSRLSTLSPREREVLMYLAQDYSVVEVATELGVRPTTIETHRQSLRAKLDVRGAAGMARFAIREGLLEP